MAHSVRAEPDEGSGPLIDVRDSPLKIAGDDADRQALKDIVGVEFDVVQPVSSLGIGPVDQEEAGARQCEDADDAAQEKNISIRWPPLVDIPKNQESEERGEEEERREAETNEFPLKEPWPPFGAEHEERVAPSPAEINTLPQNIAC